MSEDKNKISRREALGTLGTVLAATAVGGLVSETAQAQAASFEFVVTKYRAYIYSAFSQESLILMQDGTGKQALLNFRKDGVALPANSLSANQLVAQAHFPLSRFDEIRDFLRYEKPVRFVLTSTGIASISNDSDELIGDFDI
jgi:hypothetical protein